MPDPRPLAPDPQSLLAALHDVQDPEFPISIVEMGLIYDLEFETATGKVTLELTYTAMGCPAYQWIQDDIRARLLKEPGVKEVTIKVVWDPPWTKACITPEGRERLRLVGVSV